jgi:hypothetical protein
MEAFDFQPRVEIRLGTREDGPQIDRLLNVVHNRPALDVARDNVGVFRRGGPARTPPAPPPFTAERTEASPSFADVSCWAETNHKARFRPRIDPTR